MATVTHSKFEDSRRLKSPSRFPLRTEVAEFPTYRAFFMIGSSDPPNGKMPVLLVVEDSNEDFEALQRLLKRSHVAISIHRCVNGEQGLAFLYQTSSYSDRDRTPRPGLIVLDLNLPGIDGREVLRRIKQDATLKTIPVVVFTTSNNPKDIEDCYRYGVNSYIVKPIDFDRLKLDIQIMVDYWFEVTTLPNFSQDQS